MMPLNGTLPGEMSSVDGGIVLVLFYCSYFDSLR